ncbi:MAG: hemerythrin domain-containing protein [Actinomycetota bacterium]
MSSDAIVMLKEDHKRFREMFRQMDDLKSEGGPRLEALMAEICHELTTHGKLEEEIFYPAAVLGVTDQGIIHEADEEHHIAELLMGEILGSSPDEPRYIAKCTVLKELVLHHIEEEEEDLFPKVREAAGRARLQEIGQQMAERRKELDKLRPVSV